MSSPHSRWFARPRALLNLFTVVLLGLIALQVATYQPDDDARAELLELRTQVFDAEVAFGETRRAYENARLCAAEAIAERRRLLSSLGELERRLLQRGEITPEETLKPQWATFSHLRLNDGEVLRDSRIEALRPKGIAVRYAGSVRLVGYPQLPEPLTVFLGLDRQESDVER